MVSSELLGGPLGDGVTSLHESYSQFCELFTLCEHLPEVAERAAVLKNQTLDEGKRAVQGLALFHRANGCGPRQPEDAIAIKGRWRHMRPRVRGEAVKKENLEPVKGRFVNGTPAPPFTPGIQHLRDCRS
ncbi:MAG: hypothetical protein ACREXK_10785 [Gammaproteobacteria bacterium]